MTEDDGSYRFGECIRGSLGRHVRYVDHHSESIHFCDGGSTERRETVPVRSLWRTGVTERVVAGVSESEVADAERVVDAERREGRSELVTAARKKRIVSGQLTVQNSDF
jgi:hypothetical protein